MCVRACLSALESCGAALNVASPSIPRVSAWSISPWTQESGPRSNSGAVSVAMRLGMDELPMRGARNAPQLCTTRGYPRRAPRVGANRGADSYLETGHGTAQLGGQLRQLRDRHIRLLGALGGLLGDLED